MADERRRAERQSWIRLESSVYIKRSLFKKEWIPVVPFDYSRYGIGLQTDEAYELGDEVVLSLKLVKEDLEIDLPMLKGFVRYKEKHHSRFNYGVEFCFASKNDKLKINEDLVSIERILKRFESERVSSVNNGGDNARTTGI
jgi:Tfp pilus assembly protein PilZ